MAWVEASIWSKRMLSALVNGVKGGKWYSLIDNILKGLERWTPTGGTPQGGVLSPLLANIYLHPLGRLMAERGYHMVRYADDLVILTRSREEVDAALALVRAWVMDNGLALHPEKNAGRRLPAAWGGFRVPRLPVRGRPASCALEEPRPSQGHDPAQTRRRRATVSNA